MSNYVVIARFDDATDKRFADVREKLNDAGCPIPEWPPHITLAAYENIDEDMICEWTSEFSKTHNQPEIGLFSLSIFPPGKGQNKVVVCVAPSYSQAFVGFYYEFHSKYEEYCTGIGYHNSISHGNPTIHATLSIIDIKDSQTAIETVCKSNVFCVAKIEALEVYTYPMRLIKRFSLNDKRQDSAC